jgi:hypothetical protein
MDITMECVFAKWIQWQGVVLAKLQSQGRDVKSVPHGHKECVQPNLVHHKICLRVHLNKDWRQHS